MELYAEITTENSDQKKRVVYNIIYLLNGIRAVGSLATEFEGKSISGATKGIKYETIIRPDVLSMTKISERV